MKRDMDLVRSIVLAIEAAPMGFAPNPLTVDGHTEDEIGYHVHIMIQGGLLRGAEATCYGDKSPQAIAVSLTWAGHEFADAARNDTRWSKAKELAVTKAGGVTVEVLTRILSSLMASALGL